MSSKNIMFI